MFGVEFKIASTNIEKNTHVIRIQQSGALMFLLEEPQSYTANMVTGRQETMGQRSSEMRSVLLFHWEERREEHIGTQGNYEHF